MKLIQLSQKDFLECIENCWKLQESFIVFANPCPVSDDWISRTLDAIPKELENGHFGILSSGSTGEPKLIIGNMQRAMSLAEEINSRQNLDQVSNTICLLPLSYSYAFINQWLWAFHFKKGIQVSTGFAKIDQLEELLRSAKNTMICLVGTQLNLIEQFFVQRNKVFPGIVHVNFAGGKFPQNELSIIKTVFPNAKIFNNYGCTEAMPRLCIRKENESPNWANVGQSLKGIQFHINEANEISFKSPFSAVACVDNGNFVRFDENNWIPTGDLGKLEKDGSLQILGRNSEVFKRFGEKISLTTLLEDIKTAWTDGAQFYIEDDKDGQQAHILVICPHPSNFSDVKKILITLRKKYARPFWPIRVESVDQFPVLSSGKVDGVTLASEKCQKTIHWEQKR